MYTAQYDMPHHLTWGARGLAAARSMKLFLASRCCIDLAPAAAAANAAAAGLYVDVDWQASAILI